MIADFPAGRLLDGNGKLIRDTDILDYLDGDRPGSVNPSLWRQSQLIRRTGLYKVTEGLYQVRFSANLTIVDAPDGLVIIDATASATQAKVGLQLFRDQLGNDKPVAAVIYPHSHFDHYGGVKGRGRRGGREPRQGPDHRAGHHRFVQQARDR